MMSHQCLAQNILREEPSMKKTLFVVILLLFAASSFASLHTKDGIIVPMWEDPGCYLTSCTSSCTRDMERFTCRTAGGAGHYTDTGSPLPVSLTLNVDCFQGPWPGIGCSNSKTVSGNGSVSGTVYCTFRSSLIGAWNCSDSDCSCQ